MSNLIIIENIMSENLKLSIETMSKSQANLQRLF